MILLPYMWQLFLPFFCTIRKKCLSLHSETRAKLLTLGKMKTSFLLLSLTRNIAPENFRKVCSIIIYIMLRAVRKQFAPRRIVCAAAYIHTYIHTYSPPIREKKSRTCPAHVPQIPRGEGLPAERARSCFSDVQKKKYILLLIKKIINYVG